ncbi:MFS transporter [Goodfellowiella coeruleoviolacea]|uniref:Uncharacterized protein n=1 Tax=Goodfellowiella coeruleoviolacea TaxID=334858 RepID=A0AAE3KGZ2_9PSEU|nr:hypothetical protein [Goodfellowiella coeruleoviolacea]MCP2167781.1 hypothetical protein [Goodfellowiella coeruleoviolacea]
MRGTWVGCLFVLTLYRQQLRGWSALETGLAVVPTGLTVVLLAPRTAPPLTARSGVTAMTAAGLTLAAIGYALLLRIDVDSNYLAVLVPGFLLVGLAFSRTLAAARRAEQESESLLGAGDDYHHFRRQLITLITAASLPRPARRQPGAPRPDTRS